jgi:tRNA pseudouridine55 synthase
VTCLTAGGPTYSGLALLRKPEGITSFQALAPLKRAVASGKVGHAGTLDRFAQGLLIALAGSYSRLAPYITAGPKLYRGLVAFGSETDTLDPEGEVVAEAAPPSRSELENALAQFRGPIMQRPPAYSAVHVGGKRAYQLALRGEEPELKERRIEIFSLELLSYEDGSALIEVRCSSGTYIRSLARDIAYACGSRAHLAALERLSIGPYSVEHAAHPGDFDPERDLRACSSQDASALGLRVLSLDDEAAIVRFSHGGKVAPELFAAMELPGVAATKGAESSEAAVFGPSGSLLGIIRLEADGPRYKVVMPPAGREGEA